MGKRRSVPEDLMGNILSENHLTTDPNAPPGEKSERIGVAFNLSKRIVADLDLLRRETKFEGEARPSRSEIAEVALHITLEDAKENGEESELFRRLNERRIGVENENETASGNVRRSVDDSGWIFETTYDEEGRVVDEDVIANVSDLPITDEYTDEQGRLVSLAKDELGNAFETVFDDSFEIILTRLVDMSHVNPKDRNDK